MEKRGVERDREAELACAVLDADRGLVGGVATERYWKRISPVG